MRWGILTNLAIILVVSGILLFAVFAASLERSTIDLKMQQAETLLNVLQQYILEAASKEKLVEKVNGICSDSPKIKLILYNENGEIVGGCKTKLNFGEPPPQETGKRFKVYGRGLPANIFQERALIVDSTDFYPNGIANLRIVLDIPASIFAPAWRFFGVYLALTQAALFLLGYVLFHRTIIEPVTDIAKLAQEGAGVATTGNVWEQSPGTNDIAGISSGIKSMVAKLVDDKTTMKKLVDDLRKANSDLEAAQQGLVRSEKLAGIGRLAAGVAHEVGNPLQIVMGYVELLQRKPDAASGEILERTDQELKRINIILQRLLDYARPEKKQVMPCDVNQLVLNTAALLKGRKGFDSYKFEFKPASNVPIVYTEPDKLRQILLNVLFNAADAIGTDAGTISIETSALDHRLEIKVSDTGQGIPEKDLEKVFDPFFTTKEPGKGTGLGLAVCLGLISSMDGVIRLESSVGVGSTVSISWPVNPCEDA